MKQEWLMPGAVVPVDMETTAALVAELKRLKTEQEPVAIRLSNNVIDVLGGAVVPIGALLYTAPRQWQGLMDEEREQVINANFATGLWQMAKDIEAKLKEKNT